MKRNMVPLLGIAFVVAIISTGVFYGLFAGKLRSSADLPGHAIVVAARDLDRGTVLQPSDLRVSQVQGGLEGAFSKPEEAAGATLLASVKTNEPLLEERVTPHASENGSAGGLVPRGMRAVSIRVSQSDGLLSLLRAGSRVDLQAVSEKDNTVQLRTVLENVQILAVSPSDANANRAGAVVTVLTRAEDADAVALADAGSRIRVALRNPLDAETTPRHSLALAALFSGQPDVAARQSGHSVAVWDHPIQLHVRALEVSDSALTELRSQLATGAPQGTPESSWSVAAFRSDDNVRKTIDSLEQKHELEVVSSERLMAGVGRPISYRAGTKPYQLSVRFSPALLATGKVTLGVRPKTGVQGTSAKNEYEAELPNISSFLVQGFAGDSAGQNAAARLFPGHSFEHKQLVIFVSARSIQQTPDAVARSDRRR
jgi:Flp pilus assembly protein CpaB